MESVSLIHIIEGRKLYTVLVRVSLTHWTHGFSFIFISYSKDSIWPLSAVFKMPFVPPNPTRSWT